MKIKMIKRRMGDCERHFVCNWMRDRMREDRSKSETIQNREREGKTKPDSISHDRHRKRLLFI